MEPAAEPDPRIGTILLDRLKVLRRVGGGGMGSVYAVEHLRTGHQRALKIIAPEYASHERFMTRLMREARVAATLRTPYVAEMLDAGTLEDGSAYVLMELLDGRPLLELIRERNRLDTREVAWLTAQVCEGLAVAHAAGIVHRDLKPENIFVVPAEEGTVQIKILDFGISLFTGSMTDKVDRLTRAGTILGTPFYMSPEQTAGVQIDHRSDLYSLGIIMYEALTGRLPYEAETIGELFLKMGTGECFPVHYHVPDIDPAFEKVVHRAFHRNADARFQTAAELQAAVIPFMKGELTRPGAITRRLAHLATVPASRTTVDFSVARPHDTNIETPLGVADTNAPPARSTPTSNPPTVRRAPSDFPPAPPGLADGRSPIPTVRPPGAVPPPPAVPIEALGLLDEPGSTAWSQQVTPHSARPKPGLAHDETVPITHLDEAPPEPRKQRGPGALIALGALLVLLVAGALYWQRRDPEGGGVPASPEASAGARPTTATTGPPAAGSTGEPSLAPAVPGAGASTGQPLPTTAKGDASSAPSGSTTGQPAHDRPAQPPPSSASDDTPTETPPTATRPSKGRTRSEAAGLDRNPYR